MLKVLPFILAFLAIPCAQATDAPQAPFTLAAAPVAANSTGRTEGSGRVSTQERSLSGFSALRVRGNVNVELKAAAKERVSVRAEENVLEFIETRMSPDHPATLEIGIAKGANRKGRVTPTVIVEFTSLRRLALEGSGKTTIDQVRGESLNVAISGSGNVAIDRAELASLDVGIAGSGDFAAGGRADKQAFSIAGSGRVKTEKLSGQSAAVSISGSGDARVNVERTLEVSIAGSGDVVYRNNPVVTKRVAGSGSVKPHRD